MSGCSSKESWIAVMCGDVLCMFDLFSRLHMGSFANIGLIKTFMLKSYCFVLFVFCRLFCHVFLGLLFDLWFALLRPMVWGHRQLLTNPLSWMTLRSGSVLMWWDFLSFIFISFFSSSLGRNPFFWKEICPYHIFLFVCLFVLGCLPFILFLGSLTTLLVWFCCIPYFSGIFLQLF